MGSRRSRLSTAVRKLNGFHLAAVIMLAALAVASFLLGLDDPLVGLNGVLVAESAALILLAAARVAPRSAARLRPVSKWVAAVAGAFTAPLIAGTAIGINAWWLLVAPLLAWALGLSAGTLKKPLKVEAGPNTHLGWFLLLVAVILGILAAGAVSGAQPAGFIAQIAMIGSTVCAAIASFDSGRRLRVANVPGDRIIEVGRSLLLLALYATAAAGPFALVSFLAGA